MTRVDADMVRRAAREISAGVIGPFPKDPNLINAGKQTIEARQPHLVEFWRRIGYQIVVGVPTQRARQAEHQPGPRRGLTDR